jgi:hypothetical protein
VLLGSNRAVRESLRARLEAARLSCPLFDTAGYACVVCGCARVCACVCVCVCVGGACCSVVLSPWLPGFQPLDTPYKAARAAARTHMHTHARIS